MNQENSDSKLCPICRPTHKESKYCIFHASVEEKNEEEFKRALKEYVNNIKEEDGSYDFKQFIFVGDIDFKKDLNITVFKNANFRKVIFDGKACFQGITFKKNIFSKNISFKGATFEKDASFCETTFKGATFEKDASFCETTFENVVYFNGATFKRNTFFDGATFKETLFSAFFNEAIFEGYTSFNKTIFEGDAYFRDATFKGKMFSTGTDLLGNLFRDHYFNGATFKRNTFFDGATFKGEAYFQGTIFKKDTFFDGATFEKDAFFKLKYFSKLLCLNETKIFPGKKCSIKINNGKGKIFFKRAYLENTYLKIKLNKEALIDFTDALIRNTKIEADQIDKHIIQEKKKEFVQAKKIYLLLKNNFHTIAQYDDESWAFKKEKDMERLSHSYPFYMKELKRKDKKEKLSFLKWIKKGNFKKWTISAFSNMIYGYGEKPWNVVIVAGALIIVFAYFFSLIGIGNPEIIELQGKIHPIPGTDMRLVSEGVLQNTKIMQFSNCLYFSLITFTTLGYGDFRPLEGLGRILAGSEAFIGAFMMALFVYTFARRTGGR